MGYSASGLFDIQVKIIPCNTFNQLIQIMGILYMCRLSGWLAGWLSVCLSVCQCLCVLGRGVRVMMTIRGWVAVLMLCFGIACLFCVSLFVHALHCCMFVKVKAQ